jgi:transcriptional regulator with XRE-family HTH domain
MITADQPKKVHHGRNIKRFREMFGLKQEALAIELGEDWSQKKVSRLEETPEIGDDLLEQVAKILKVPVEAIKNFSEEAAMTFIANTFNSHDHSNSVNYNLNPIEKIVELYERMLTLEREKVALLEKMLDQKK